MFTIVVCIKQVPMVSELPWNAKTGTLKRELAQGMMDPASRQALEAALQIKEGLAASGKEAFITAVSMGPPMAEEVLHQANALGTDQGILLTDRRMAGADTCLTSFILARCIRKFIPDPDLVLCGTQTSDSETAQVGPQLACELDMPEVGWASELNLTPAGKGPRVLEVCRHVDDFFEVLEMDLPGLVTVDQGAFSPRHTALGGVAHAFASRQVRVVTAEELGLDKSFNALKDSPTRIVDVYSPTTQKENRVLKGAAKTVVDKLFKEFGKTVSSAMGKDLNPE